jgi:hypothetical protein
MKSCDLSKKCQTYRAARRSIGQRRDWLGRFSKVEHAKAQAISKGAIFHSLHDAATL